MHKCKLESVEGTVGTETQRQWCVPVGKQKNNISASPEKLPPEAEKKEGSLSWRKHTAECDVSYMQAARSEIAKASKQRLTPGQSRTDTPIHTCCQGKQK